MLTLTWWRASRPQPASKAATTAASRNTAMARHTPPFLPTAAAVPARRRATWPTPRSTPAVASSAVLRVRACVQIRERDSRGLAQRTPVVLSEHGFHCFSVDRRVVEVELSTCTRPAKTVLAINFEWMRRGGIDTEDTERIADAIRVLPGVARFAQILRRATTTADHHSRRGVLGRRASCGSHRGCDRVALATPLEHSCGSPHSAATATEPRPQGQTFRPPRPQSV